MEICKICKFSYEEIDFPNDIISISSSHNVFKLNWHFNKIIIFKIKNLINIITYQILNIVFVDFLKFKSIYKH